MARIYIGSKLGTVERVRKQVDSHIPRSAGCVTFYRDGLVVETIQTTNMREIVYESMCGWIAVHSWEDLAALEEKHKIRSSKMK